MWEVTGTQIRSAVTDMLMPVAAAVPSAPVSLIPAVHARALGSRHCGLPLRPLPTLHSLFCSGQAPVWPFVCAGVCTPACVGVRLECVPMQDWIWLSRPSLFWKARPALLCSVNDVSASWLASVPIPLLWLSSSVPPKACRNVISSPKSSVCLWGLLLSQWEQSRTWWTNPQMLVG